MHCVVSHELMISDREVYSPNKISDDFKDLWGSDERVKY